MALDVIRQGGGRLNLERAKRAPELAAAMAESDLLFPAEPNGRNHGCSFRTKSSLARAFEDVG